MGGEALAACILNKRSVGSCMLLRSKHLGIGNNHKIHPGVTLGDSHR
jgi:hypothetical protein